MKTNIMLSIMIAVICITTTVHAQNDSMQAKQDNMPMNDMSADSKMMMPDIKSWPMPSQMAAKEAMEKFGKPSEMTESMLVWRNAGPYHKVVVYNQVENHNFPMPHPDVMEYFVDFKVPADKVDDVLQSDGSITVKRTNGMMSARCDKDANNVVALNCAYDVATGKRSVEDARKYHAQLAMELKNGGKPEYSQKLNFTPQPGAGDPDMVYKMQ